MGFEPQVRSLAHLASLSQPCQALLALAGMEEM